MSNYYKNMDEAVQSGHFLDRSIDRLKNTHLTTPEFDYEQIRKQIEYISQITFPSKLSIAIRIFRTKTRYTSRDWDNVLNKPGKVNSFGEDVWVIVRDSTITTIMFRGKGQYTSPKDLQVNAVLFNIGQIPDVLENAFYYTIFKTTTLNNNEQR